MTEIMVDAEVVDPISSADAERLDRRIRLLVQTIADNWTKLYDLVAQAKHGEIQKTLGYSSWTAYVADIFSVQVRLDREQRRELVGYLSGEGMSQRVIADVVGVDQATVNRDLRDANASPDDHHVDEHHPHEAMNDIAEAVVSDARTQAGNAESTPIIGRDGKTYSKPKASHANSRRKSFNEVVNYRFLALGDDIDRLEQLIRSDRFQRNRAQIEGVEKIPGILSRFGARLDDIGELAGDSPCADEDEDAPPRPLATIAGVLSVIVDYCARVDGFEPGDFNAEDIQYADAIFDSFDLIRGYIEPGLDRDEAEDLGDAQ